MLKRQLPFLIISLFTLIITFCFTGILSTVAAANSFTLSDGQVELAPDKSEEYRIIARQLFSNLVITVADDGNMSGEAQSPFNFELNGDNYSGQSSISVKGVYDSEKHTIIGTYTYTHNRIRRGKHKSGNPYELEGSANYPNTKLSGTVDGNTVKLELVNFGSVSYSVNVSTELSDKANEYQDQLNWAITSAAKENERNNKIYTGNINAELGEGGFSDMFGQVEVNVPNADGTYDEENWNYARLDGKTLPVGTHIKTFNKSGVIINFGQMIVRLGPDSELVIKKFPDQPGHLEMLYGNLKANVKKMMKDGSMEVEMSQAVAGIKGTIFDLEGTKDTSTLKVIEGSVSFKSKSNGNLETVNAGESLSASKNGLGQKTAFDTGEVQSKWDTFDKEMNPSVPKISPILYVGLAVLAVIIISIILRFRKKTFLPPREN